MRPLIRLLLLALAGFMATAQAAAPLITPAELAPLIDADAVRVIDIREAEAYAMQHVPSAVSAPYGRWRVDDDNMGLVPPLPELIELVQELGLQPDTYAVIVYTGIDATDFGGAARAYWTLKSLGMTKLSILHGGLTAWKDAGNPISDMEAVAERSHWQPQFNSQWMATRDDVLASLDDAGVLRIDARPAPYFDGRIAHDNARARGTIRGAVHLDSEDLFELGTAMLMDEDSLQSEADMMDVTPEQSVIAFCNAGHWSSTDWFVLSELLDYPQVRMYPGSVIDWTRASAPLPMDNEPDRWEQLRYMMLSWSSRNLGTQAP